MTPPWAHAYHDRECTSTEREYPMGRRSRVRNLPAPPWSGRIHHCMRFIGAAERALDLMIERGQSREAFGRPLLDLGKNMETVSRVRIEIETMRMMVLKAAKAMDVLGNKEARVWVSIVKAMVPKRCCQIIDEAIQIHGTTGVSQWSPLPDIYQAAYTKTGRWSGRGSSQCGGSCRSKSLQPKPVPPG